MTNLITAALVLPVNINVGEVMKSIADPYRDFLYDLPIEETDYNKRYLKKFDLFTQYVDKDILLSEKLRKLD